MTARRKKWSGVGKLSETSSGCLTIWRGSFRFRFRFRRLATESKNGLVRVLWAGNDSGAMLKSNLATKNQMEFLNICECFSKNSGWTS